jgi:hypothetical protein
MTIINNVWIYDSSTSELFYGSYDDQFLGVIGTEQETWSLATQEQIDDKQSLENKAIQIAQAKLNRDNLQYANIEYKNSIFKANSDTQAKMTARALSIELEAKSGVDLALIEVIWYDINDEGVTWTAIEFMGLFTAVLTRANTLYAECNAIVNAIKNPAQG